MITPSLIVLPEKESRDLVKKMLKEKEWKEVRPGCLEKSAIYPYDAADGKPMKMKFTEKEWVCCKCRCKDPSLFTLNEVPWKELMPNDGVICLKCLDNLAMEKWGRRIFPEDLKDIPANQDFIYLLEYRKSLWEYRE